MSLCWNNEEQTKKRDQVPESRVDSGNSQKSRSRWFIFSNFIKKDKVFSKSSAHPLYSSFRCFKRQWKLPSLSLAWIAHLNFKGIMMQRSRIHIHMIDKNASDTPSLVQNPKDIKRKNKQTLKKQLIVN